MPPDIRTNLLSEDAFQRTLASPMRNVTKEATNVIDIWPYVAAVNVEDLRGHEVYDRFVEFVYRDPTGRFDHVLVMTRTKNVYLAIVVDLSQDRIHGHQLLDLNEKYGLVGRETPQP
jgi:hypothetical protein